MFEQLGTGSAAIEKPLDVLAIAAHPDDVEQTCGGTLIRMAGQGYRTGVLDITAGDMGSRGTPEIRFEEADAAARQMRLAWRGNLRLPDARLENTISVRMTLAMEIRNLRPRVVILPYWEARHPDHYRASEIGFEACFLAGLKKLDEETRAAPAEQDRLLVAVTPTSRHRLWWISPITSSGAWPRCSAINRNTANRAKHRSFSPINRRFANGWARSPDSTAI